MASPTAISESVVDESEPCGLTRRDIFFILKGQLRKNAADAYKDIEKYMTSKLQRPFTLPNNIKPVIRKLSHDLRVKWQRVSRTENKFLENYSKWLSAFVFFDTTKQPLEKSDKMVSPSSEFAESCGRTKRRRIGEEFPAEKSTGNSNMANLSRVEKRTTDLIQETTLSADAALSLMVELKLSKSQYQVLHDRSKENSCNLFPPYKLPYQAKLKCYPPKSNITVDENSAEVKLQALLNHTAYRILLTQMNIIKCLSPENVRNLTFICKWGCNGTSSHGVCKQEFSDEQDNESNGNIFFISLVPLQIFHRVNSHLIIWKNPRPSSPRYCRPIKITFLNKTAAPGSITEIEYIKMQASHLVPFQTVIDGKEINVDFELMLTTVDGNVNDSDMNTSSSMYCYLCQATLQEFNDIDEILQKPIKESHLEYGISSMHAWVRFFECCLHMCYKLKIKKSHGCQEDEESVESRKKYIQQGFRDRLGIIVDQTKQGAYESSNDSNTARRFFENSEISASITGLDQELIERFHTILQVISCGFEINIRNFQNYTEDTARKFVELYPWYSMPTTVHKILIHGYKYLDSLFLPIGQMCEEVQESHNKYIERFPEDFVRKCDRIKNMEDIFCKLLVTSDPLISSLQKLTAKELKSLSPHAVELLVPPSVGDSSDYISSSDTSDDDDDDDDDTDY